MLNDNDDENFEPNVPPLNDRISTFSELSELIGKEKVVWRFDTLILTTQPNELTCSYATIGLMNFALKL